MSRENKVEKRKARGDLLSKENDSLIEKMGDSVFILPSCASLTVPQEAGS